MTSQHLRQTISGTLPTVIGVGWVAIVTVSHIYYNLPYYTSKITSFAGSIIRNIN
jgi:hypothetical protein